MLETLRAVGGLRLCGRACGCSAPGVVVDAEGGVIELVNPAIIEVSAETREVQEGSIAPGAPRGMVNRPQTLTVTGFDRTGKPVTVTGSDFLAATLCHEIDHLDGILFTDKTAPRKTI